MPEPVRNAEGSEKPTATLDEIDIRAELQTRPCRLPDYEIEDRAFATLAKEMAQNPRNMLQKLVETAVELCGADTAGISLLEGDVFRWEAVAGVFASYRNGTMPRAASPCGICIDRDATQLMHLADRHFPALRAEPRFVEALLIPFHSDGKPVGTVWVVAHDDRRKFDRTDEHVMRALSEFASAGWQLWKAREVMEAELQRKDEFLAMLGHELRNPLAAILSATGVLKMHESYDAPTQHGIDVVTRQAQRLTRLAQDLLDLSRLSQRKLELQLRTIDVRTVVASAIEASRPEIERLGHSLDVELPTEPIWVHADASRLTQMLTNLLDNAAKYTREVGAIRVTVARDGREARMSVRDSGIGIRHDQLDQVFDLFKQVGPSAQRLDGLGLGLALVRSLAAMHDGSVVAASDGVGAGSEFTVRLPIARAPSTISPPPSHPTVALPRRILLVEDNVDLAESFALGLTLEGHSVRVAHDGPAALDAFRAFAPDVVLLDGGLPGMDGYEVARRMRKERLSAELMIIALTGFGRDEDRKASAEAGCDAHVVKPVAPEELRKVLDRPR
jgi:signal transduction histidine kinase